MTGSDHKDEGQEFIDAVSDVTPLEPHNVAEHQSKGADSPGPSRPGKDSTTETEPEDEFVRGGVQRKLLQNLRSGKIPIERELDLHGYTAKEAEPEVHSFLLRSRVAGRQRAVRIIHGKGLRSPNNKSVLKEKVREWLRHNDAVLAYCQAAFTTGGSGAVHILLKRR